VGNDISGINLTDKYGNRRGAWLQGVYEGGTPTHGDIQNYLQALGLPSFDPAVTVLNTGTFVDTSSPTILSLRTSAPIINVTNGNSTLSIELDISEVSGFIDDGYEFIGGINLDGPSGQSIYFGLSKADIIAQVNNTVSFRKTIELGIATPGGKWYISGINITDKYGNRRDAWLQGVYEGGTPTQGDIQNYLQALGLPSADPSFTVVNTGTFVDANRPVIAALRISSDNASIPYVVLALSPSSVTEDGSANLIYTFSRTGDTTNSLTVNYNVAGSADSADYTGATPGAGKTITFAAGSATAILAINPTADTTIEANETVALTLAAGTGYSIGTTAAVTGTITDDDFPVITLAVAPATVTEDGTTNLVYTFSRTGATTSALSINYTVGGTATLGTDYTGIAATPATKTVTFAAGATTATVTVDPMADTTIEPNETVALTLAAGTGYSIGTTAAVVGTILNRSSAPGTGPDALAPTIQGLSFGASSLYPSQPGGAYLSAALRFSDNLSGFSSGSLQFRSSSSGPSSSGQSRGLWFSSSNIQGSTLAGILYASQKLDPFTAAGTWVLDSIQLNDKAGNSLSKFSSSSDWSTFLSSSGITQTSFQVAYGANPTPGTGPDTLAPTIQGLSFGASSLDPSQPGGAYLSAALRFSDNLSGFSSGYLQFRSSSSGLGSVPLRGVKPEARMP
jgi:hypothetical protein